ncbi:hypothetical protein VCRA2113O324_190031 [Vibrio crassostreae]|uniref:NYN domain-containing protein n=1 Tax=Vibrio artabrorum TaxID=446374 RepID=UPI002A6DFAAA|nr:hypothetical protein VCRA2111O320_190030 [Vibrio crassostreae]CAK1831042.1 hypothetical protein VCRA2113O324_190031 [Vibrio crassostreae]CAK2706275.1 hypothetical protein VCRA2121O336_190077 [Vibrio crassostreae]CAK3192953.1 hypothetical protein VCRA2120O329_180030 [Vibrio crassostreae]CAK3855802.1 hypothetical protein VCRA2128O347_220030 [Vibrio crassostreae]
MAKKYVIDGTNVCYWYKNLSKNDVRFSLLPLLSVVLKILENGDDVYCVFDATTERYITENYSSELMVYNFLLSDLKDNFYCVTGGTRADDSILHYADEYNCSVISNDKYRDYASKYQWLDNSYSERLVRGNLQPDGLMTLTNIPYGNITLTQNIDELIEQVKVEISSKRSNSYTYLSRKVDALNARIEKLEQAFIQLSEQVVMDESNQLSVRKEEKDKALELQSSWAQIRLEMTESQVEKLLGKPSARDGHHYPEYSYKYIIDDVELLGTVKWLRGKVLTFSAPVFAF